MTAKETDEDRFEGFSRAAGQESRPQRVADDYQALCKSKKQYKELLEEHVES